MPGFQTSQYKYSPKKQHDNRNHTLVSLSEWWFAGKIPGWCQVKAKWCRMNENKGFKHVTPRFGLIDRYWGKLKENSLADLMNISAYVVIEGSLEVKLPTIIWADGKAQMGRVREEVRSQLAGWETKNCTALWREDHFEVKKLKKLHGQSTFGSWDVEKVRAVVARSTCGSQDVKKHLRFGTLWEVEMSKKCMARSTFPNQNVQNPMLGALLEAQMSKKCTQLWREAHFEVNMYKTHTILGTFFEVRMWFCVAGARDSAPCQKWARREGFVTFPKTMAGVGHSKRTCKDAFRVAGAVQETCSERGCILEHRIFRSAKANLRDRCSTSYDLASFFPGRRNILDRWNKNRKTHWYEASSFALNFHVWRNSCRLASFLTLSS